MIYRENKKIIKVDSFKKYTLADEHSYTQDATLWLPSSLRDMSTLTWVTERKVVSTIHWQTILHILYVIIVLLFNCVWKEGRKEGSCLFDINIKHNTEIFIGKIISGDSH